MTHILLLEDDAGTATEIMLELVAQGFAVTYHAVIADALARCEATISTC